MFYEFHTKYILILELRIASLSDYRWLGLSRIQNNNLGLDLADALHGELVSSVDALNESTIALGKLSILPAVQADLALSTLGHGHMHKDLALGLGGGPAADGPLEGLGGGDDTSGHDEVGVDGNGVGDHRLGGLLLLGGGVNSSLEGAEDLDKGLALRLLAEVAGVVLGGKAALPRDSPDLEEVDGVGLVLVEL